MDETPKEPYSFTAYIGKLKSHPIDARLLKSLAFYAGVNEPDDAAAVVRSAAYLEDLLLELVLRNLEHPDLINPSAFSFSQRVRWAHALGEVGPKTVAALKALARIRNKLAHTHTEVIADEGLIKNFIKAAAELPTGDSTNWKLPDEVKAKFNPPMTDLRWKMRMAISVLSSVLNSYIILPPLRQRQRPGPGEGRPDIHVHADYKPQPPI